jgi:hypothetical protein
MAALLLKRKHGIALESSCAMRKCVTANSLVSQARIIDMTLVTGIYEFQQYWLKFGLNFKSWKDGNQF